MWESQQTRSRLSIRVICHASCWTSGRYIFKITPRSQRCRVPYLNDLSLWATKYISAYSDTGISHEIVIRVLTAVFGTTLAMISTDFNSFPEIRMAFFSFLKSIIKYNFEQLYNMPEDKFHTIMDCIVWSIKHELNTFSDLGLDLLFETLQNLTNNPAISNIFYERYYTNLLKDILEVLTDGYHKSGFKMQCKILFLMFQVVLSNYVPTHLIQLSSKIGGATQIESNQEYLYNYLVNTLSSAFTNVSKQDTMNKVRSMLSLSDEKLFKVTIHSFRHK